MFKALAPRSIPFGKDLATCWLLSLADSVWIILLHHTSRMAPRRALRADEPPHDDDEAPQQEQIPISEGVPTVGINEPI